jgi:TatA/E family protein of Tat protein translocase
MFTAPGPLELAVILIIALIVLGPKRLPEAARSVGRGVRELREAMAAPDFSLDDKDDKDDEDDAHLDDPERFEPHDEDEEPEPKASEPQATDAAPEPQRHSTADHS